MRNGFTLIELMVVMVIMTILITIGVPSFRSIMGDNQATSAANELLYALQLARAEAVKRNVPVSVCPSSDQNYCTLFGNWQVGWIVFEDTGGTGIRLLGSEIIRVQNVLDSAITFSGPSSIQYSVGGYLASATLTSIQASATNSSNNKWVCITAVGFAKVQSTSC